MGECDGANLYVPITVLQSFRFRNKSNYYMHIKLNYKYQKVVRIPNFQPTIVHGSHVMFTDSKIDHFGFATEFCKPFSLQLFT